MPIHVLRIVKTLGLGRLLGWGNLITYESPSNIRIILLTLGAKGVKLFEGRACVNVLCVLSSKSSNVI